MNCPNNQQVESKIYNKLQRINLKTVLVRHLHSRFLMIPNLKIQYKHQLIEDVVAKLKEQNLNDILVKKSNCLNNNNNDNI